MVDVRADQSGVSSGTPSRRDVLAGAGTVGATILAGALPATAEDNRVKTFTILHTNDMHSTFIGMGPASDYTPFTLNDDTTRAATRAWPR